jgi:hypothetical protein
MSSGRWTELEGRPPASVTVDGVALTPGSRVTLCPRPGADVMDVVLSGRIASSSIHLKCNRSQTPWGVTHAMRA